MSNLIRGISENGGVVFCGVDSTEIVRTAEQLHHTSATCSAALGRLLTGASLMGSMLKDDGDSITLRVAGGGPTGTVVACTDGTGNVKGCIDYCHHHSKGAQGGKRSMDRASGSGVFARDPDAMLDMTELTPTDAIRDQLKNKAACAACTALLDARGHADSYSQDDACSRTRMLAIAKEQLGLADLRALDADIAARQKRAAGMTAWRLEASQPLIPLRLFL